MIDYILYRFKYVNVNKWFFYVSEPVEISGGLEVED